MASLRVTVTEDNVKIVAEGNLNQREQVVEAACEAFKQWRLCDIPNPP